MGRNTWKGLAVNRTAPAILPPAMPAPLTRTAPAQIAKAERCTLAIDDSAPWAALDLGDILEAEAEARDILARH